MNPQHSLRKIFGIYERELNPWLETMLPRVRRVLDVGANDGYFTFGCAAVFKRLGKMADIVAFEPSANHAQSLRKSLAWAKNNSVRIEIVQRLIGDHVHNGTTTLDALSVADRTDTLIKIDVEGAEMNVIAGAHSWLTRSNAFVIEVHDQRFIKPLIELFANFGVSLTSIVQQPNRLLGPEKRSRGNMWLVSLI